MSDPLEDFLSRWDGVDPLDGPASPARDLVLAAQFEDEVQNGGLAQFLWNRFPRWEAILDGAERAYRAMGAERQLSALPEIRAVLRENAPLCARRIELAKNETEPGQAFSVWYESAEERMGLPSEELFYPDEPMLAAARRAYLEANRAALGDGPQGRARGKRPMKRPPTSRRARIACWALFLVCLFLPLPLSIAFGAPFRLLHGLETMDTGNVMEARGGPWPFFVMRDLTFVLVPALAVLFAFAVRRLRAWKALVCALALGLLGCGLRQCYVPEFDLAWLGGLGSSEPTVWIRTRHRPEFSRNAFLRLPLGSTREEVRARIGDGYSGILGHGPNPEWNAVAEWYATEELLRKKQLDPGFVFPDASPSWQMTGWGNSESYWRCWVSFDENGRLNEKYIGWWWD
jgi:hypothetical protein